MCRCMLCGEGVEACVDRDTFCSTLHHRASAWQHLFVRGAIMTDITQIITSSTLLHHPSASSLDETGWRLLDNHNCIVWTGSLNFFFFWRGLCLQLVGGHTERGREGRYEGTGMWSPGGAWRQRWYDFENDVWGGVEFPLARAPAAPRMMTAAEGCGRVTLRFCFLLWSDTLNTWWR